MLYYIFNLSYTIELVIDPFRSLDPFDIWFKCSDIGELRTRATMQIIF